jgi:dTDP-4-amino-4,6-dideoxygalactose transaminase
MSQLQRADVGLARRKKIAETYYYAFLNKPYIKSQSGIIDGHAYHLYIIEVAHRDELLLFLRQCNIWCQIHYIPAHLMPYYRQFGWNDGDMPVAEAYYHSCISLPVFPSLSEKEQIFVIEKINHFYNESS